MSVQMVELQSSGLTATISPLGAELQSLRTSGGLEIIWKGDPASWPDHAPVLFPLIGPLVDGKLRHEGETYTIPPHGFTRFKVFEIVEQTDRSVRFELKADDDTRSHYPFDFRFEVLFELGDDNLWVTMQATNEGDSVMPADVGFHPGFSWPLEPDHDKLDYSITFDHDEPAPIRRGAYDPILLYPEGQPSPVEGNVLHLRDELFEAQAIVFDQLNSRSVTYGAPGAIGLQIEFPDSPHLGVWMAPGSEFIAIEPWHGIPSELEYTGDFGNKPGIAHVEPGASRQWRYGISLLNL